MAVPLLLIGAALQMGSQWAANSARGEQELLNAKWYDEQANFASENMYRALKRTEVSYAMQYGSQVSAYAKGGVDVGSGSALAMISNTLASSYAELAAVKKEGEMNIKLARSRGQLAQDEGKMLTSFGYNAVQAGTTAFNTYAGMKSSNNTGWLSNGSPGGFDPQTTRTFEWSDRMSRTG